MDSSIIRKTFVFLMAILQFPHVGYASISRVQYKNNVCLSGSSCSITFDSSTTSGNLIVMAGSSYYDSSYVGTWSVSDSKSNTYTQALADGNGSLGRVQIWYAYGVTGGASHQVTLSSTGSSPVYNMTIIEYSGVGTSSPLDVIAKSGYTPVGGTSYTSGSVATTNANNLLLGVNHYFSGTITCTGDSGWTVFTHAVNSTYGDSHCVQDQIVSATASYQASGTWSYTPAGSYTADMATFKQAIVSAPGSSKIKKLIKFKEM